MCCNGIRCLVKFCYENNIIQKKKINVETLAGVKQTWLLLNQNKVESVKVDMGKPSFFRHSIPMAGNGKCINERLKINDKTFFVTCLSVGNPHCVLIVEDLESFPVEKIGPKIENHNIFYNRINVDFIQILNKKEIKLRVWERGVGETLACGTGACASSVASYILGKTNREVTVHLPGGDLDIAYKNNIYMKGAVAKIYRGEIFKGF